MAKKKAGQKKDTADMLFRGVPVDLRSEINEFCEKKGLLLRDFLELAIHTLKQKPSQDDQGAGLFEAEQTAKNIERRLELYDRMATLQAGINKLDNPIAIGETALDANMRSRMRADLKRMTAKLAEQMDTILPEGEAEKPPVEMPVSKWDTEVGIERAKRIYRETTGQDLESYLKDFAKQHETGEVEPSTETEENAEDAFDELLRAGEEEGGPAVFGEKATPERKAEVERIGKELEKRASKKVLDD